MEFVVLYVDGEYNKFIFIFISVGFMVVLGF